LIPIQKVRAAPAIDPAVASSGTIHQNAGNPRREQDHRAVDAEGEREEEGRVEGGKNDHAGGGRTDGEGSSERMRACYRQASSKAGARMNDDERQLGVWAISSAS